MDDQQALVDRLVVVVEEEDVLYTLVVLQDLKDSEAGFLEEALDRHHSWKGYSALQSISHRAELSQLHRLIAQLLLLEGASREFGKVGVKMNTELQELVSEWESKGRECARDAQHLASIDIGQAADWIDANLPLPPNPEKLTGDGPLPSPSRSRIHIHTPSPPLQSILSKSSFLPAGPSEDPLPVPSSSDESLFAPPNPSLPVKPLDSFTAPAISSLPVKPVLHRRESTTSSLGSTASDLSPTFDSQPNLVEPQLDQDQMVQLRLSEYPPHFSDSQLRQLFDNVGVPVESRPIIITRISCIVQIPFRHVKHCLNEVHGRNVDGRHLSCVVEKEQRRKRPFATLAVRGIVSQARRSRVQELFNRLTVITYGISFERGKGGRNIAGVIVEATEVDRCIQELHGSMDGDLKITCEVATTKQTLQLQPTPSRSPSPPRRGRPALPSPPLNSRSRSNSPSRYRYNPDRSPSPDSYYRSRRCYRKRSPSPPPLRRRRDSSSPPRHRHSSRSGRHRSPSPRRRSPSPRYRTYSHSSYRN